MQPSQGDVLWTPPPDARRRSEVGRYLDWLESQRGLTFADYHALHRWSVDDLEGFWASLWDFFEVRADAPYERVLASDDMPGAVWFPGAQLNYAAHAVGRDEDVDEIAVLARSQTRAPFDLTFGDLRDQVARARAGLSRAQALVEQVHAARSQAERKATAGTRTINFLAIVVAGAILAVAIYLIGLALRR